MKLKVTKSELNVIQVALDHLCEMHQDVLADAILANDTQMMGASYRIIKTIGEIHAEIEYTLTKKQMK